MSSSSGASGAARPDGTGVDFSKPMFWEVAKVGADYDTWVHKPVMQKSFRMFDNGVLEYFSQAPWYIIPTFWLPIVAFLTKTALSPVTKIAPISGNASVVAATVSTEPGLSLEAYSVGIALGLFLWTFLEYIIHRYLFHAEIKSNSPFLIMGHFLLHGQHHKFPMDKNRLVFPIVPGCVMGSAIYFGIVGVLFPYKLSLAVMSGVLIGYICYDLVHYFCHFGGGLRFLHEIKRSHMHHHFQDQSNGYGISSTLWDNLFQTSNKKLLD